MVGVPNLIKNSPTALTTAPISDTDLTIPIDHCEYFYDRNGNFLPYGVVLSPDNLTETYTEECLAASTSAPSGAGNLIVTTRGYLSSGTNGLARAWGTGTKVRVSLSLGVWEQVQTSMPNRNIIINGDCRVNQRVTAYTLVKDAYTWDSSDLYGPDRHEGMATGTAVSAGTWGQTATATAGHSGYAFTFAGVTLTGTGILWHRTRIEAKDACELKNQIASFGCYVWQDTGSTHNYTIYVRKANAADNFSAVTEIGHSAAQSVPSGGTAPGTFIKFEGLSMGDCSNGIEIEIKNECGAVTTKNFEQSELQIEKGSVCTAFEVRAYSTELSRCEIYYQRFDSNTPYQYYGVVGYAVSGSVYLKFPFLRPMRASPSISQDLTYTDFAVGDGSNIFVLSGNITLGGAITNYTPTINSITIAAPASGLTTGKYYNLFSNNNIISWIALSAEL